MSMQIPTAFVQARYAAKLTGKSVGRSGSFVSFVSFELPSAVSWYCLGAGPKIQAVAEVWHLAYYLTAVEVKVGAQRL
jgi:hypothetical protein